MLTVKKIDVVSLATIFAVMYAILGFISGTIITLLSLLNIGKSENLLFGVGSIILVPIIYGIMGAVGGALLALLYNIAAKWVGGIAIETE